MRRDAEDAMCAYVIACECVCGCLPSAGTTHRHACNARAEVLNIHFLQALIASRNDLSTVARSSSRGCSSRRAAISIMDVPAG